MRSRPFATRWLVLASFLAASPAAAQPRPQPQPQPAPAGQPSAERLNEARAHYDRGLKLFDEGAYDGARVEFQKAYDLVPSFKILYNLGLVHRQLVDYASALNSFERYLAEGGLNIEESRRAEVTREIESLKSRVGSLNVTANVAGAEISVDDVLIGRTPLTGPVRVNPGNRKVSATKAGRVPASRVVQVAGSSVADIRLDLAETRTVLIVDKPPRRVPWGGWAATAALAIGAGVTGYLTLQSDSKLEDARAKPEADPDDLESRGSTTRVLGITADVLTVGAVAAGALSLYYTIKWGKEHERAGGPNSDQSAPSAARTLSVGLRPAGFGVSGSF
ncbi:MAG TPA: PEGA domain-containing protein [Polyangiaceae bacterium]|nr:PEGA domain-containing protein [Polyangiaceae bacterium]